jgi:hypothetical protein
MAKITSLRNTVAGIGLAAVMLFAGAMGALILAGCDTEAKGSPSDLVCECEDKEHFVPCDCPAIGTEKCECTVQPRGNITLGSVQVPIYQDAGVSDADAGPATQNIIDGFNTLSGGKKAALDGKLKEIRIIASASGIYSGYYEYEIDNGKIILKIQYDLNATDVFYCFFGFVNYDLPGLDLSAQAKARNSIKLADGNGVPAKHSVAPVAQFGKRNAIRALNRIAMARIKSSRQYC